MPHPPHLHHNSHHPHPAGARAAGLTRSHPSQGKDKWQEHRWIEVQRREGHLQDMRTPTLDIRQQALNLTAPSGARSLPGSQPHSVVCPLATVRLAARLLRVRSIADFPRAGNGPKPSSSACPDPLVILLWAVDESLVHCSFRCLSTWVFGQVGELCVGGKIVISWANAYAHDCSLRCVFTHLG